MILIADSGSTKTDWTLIHSLHPMMWDVIATFQSQGITPIHQTPDEIRQILARELMSQLSTFPRAALINSKVLEGSLLSQINVYFYGSGCTPAHVPMMKQILSEVFSPQKIEVHSDLTAAARALCQYEPGIACILGTGANSCLYDGKEIVQNTPALGYILGDEGSGSVLGRLFMNAIFKNPKFADIRDEYLTSQKLTQADIINKVYRESMPNRFLATTSLSGLSVTFTLSPSLYFYFMSSSARASICSIRSPARASLWSAGSCPTRRKPPGCGPRITSGSWPPPSARDSAEPWRRRISRKRKRGETQ